ncbi:MAG: hypothetical protein BWY15_01742 [Firmicutes bacterium ADurb.Bin193]|nr:MAG: hypothetical protein BWY15_01742 [Firmicutes bacterium ADurb.Bin193]
MKVNIHLNTVKKYYEEKLNKKVEGKIFANDITGETYCLFFEKGTNISLFALKDDKDVVCMDSNGEAVNAEKLYGYINHVYAYGEYAGMTFDAEKLNLNYKGQPIDIADLMEYEKQMCPERTNIVLSGVFQRKAVMENLLENFCVDEVIYVKESDFASIANGNNSDILKDYLKRNYERVENARTGVAVINENGDGLLIDTQGYDYARYMCYAPKIGMYIDKQLELAMQQKATTELKLYVPLDIRLAENGSEYVYEDDMESVNGNRYTREIRTAINNSMSMDGERGLAEYLDDTQSIKQKVYSLKPTVEIYNDVLQGVMVARITEPLTYDELTELKEYCTGQFSDGWGESFEQHEISVSDGEIYVHFWNSEDYYIKTDEELSVQEQQNGMQGMSM